MKKKSLRKTGDILLDMEPLLEELVHQHGLQYSDVLGLVYVWLQVHAPSAQERYLDGSKPTFFYGAPEGLK